MKDFDEKIHIDKGNLDTEWLQQSELYYEISTELADAKREYEDIKLEIDIKTGELYKDIKSNPEKYGLDKVTEAAISSCLPTVSELIELKRSFIKSKHNVDIIQAGVNAFEMKKKALENLVYLHGQSYFAEPRAKGAEEIVKKNTRKRIQERLND